jgi:predicted aspartyl protease
MNKIEIENVKAGIAPVAGELLLGQSFLSRFKSWSIDNAKQAWCWLHEFSNAQ